MSDNKELDEKYPDVSVTEVSTGPVKEKTDWGCCFPLKVVVTFLAGVLVGYLIL